MSLTETFRLCTGAAVQQCRASKVPPVTLDGFKVLTDSFSVTVTNLASSSKKK